MRNSSSTSFIDTGITWIGSVPSDWRMVSIKSIAQIILGKMRQDKPASEEDTLEKYLCAKDVHLDGINWYEPKEMYFSPAEKRALLVKDGDLLIVEGGAGAGGAFVAHNPTNDNFYVQNSINIVRAHKCVLPQYLYYWVNKLVTNGYVEVACNVATIPHFTKEKVSSVQIPLPSLDTQRRIVSYLDSHVTSIDKRVSLLATKRDHYLRLKTAIINRAVTQGLNPEVKMKESGVEWIGMIPEHWDWHRLKDLGNLYGGLTGKSGDDFRAEDEEGTKPFIPFTNILNNARIDFSQFKSVVMADDEKGQNKVKNQDILFLMSSEDYESIAKTSVVDGDPGEVYLNSFCRGFRMHSKIAFAPFVNYQLASEKYRDALRFEARGFTRINIKIDRIASMFVCLPSMEEQVSIVAYLDDKLGAIDKNIEIINQQIEKHKLLKRALINEVITGQRAV